MWDVQERQVVIAGERGGQKFEELVSASRQLYRPARQGRAVSAGDVGAPVQGRARRLARGRCPEASRSCERCGDPLPAGLRAEARYCSKRCRQAASRARLKDRPPSPPPSPPETCSWCGGPMPAGVRLEARFCSKRCRQASSRHALRVRRSSPKISGSHSTSRARGAKTEESGQMRLERVAVGDVIKARIKGRSLWGEVTEVKDGIVYFSPDFHSLGVGGVRRARDHRPLEQDGTSCGRRRG